MKKLPWITAALVCAGLSAVAVAQNTLPPSQGVALWTWNGSIWVPYNPGSLGGAVTIADGADVAEGAKADVAYTTGSGSIIAILKGIFANSGAAVPAGTAIIGKVGIDQTTPGTTNLVALAANQSVNLAQVGGTNTVNGGVAGSQSVGGTAATNVAITANPMNLGAQGVSSENGAVTTARQVQLVADLVGKLIVMPYANPENFVSGVTAAMTATTSTSVIASPGGSLRNYITQCTFSNSHATVGTMMNLQDGSGGTTIYSVPAAAVYGGATISFPTPLRQPTAATALFVVNATTGANTFAACSGYKGL